MQEFTKKALTIVLDAVGSAAMLITIGMLAILVGAVGGFVGYSFARQYDLSVSAQYSLETVCALLAPVLLAVWLWRRVVRPDDDPPPTS